MRMVAMILGIWICFTFVAPLVHADSQQAYKDYLYQFDQYRSIYNEFTVAKNEFLKFNTLTSEATALTKTKAMISRRDELLRSYLLVLTEKLNEVQEMNPVDRALYQTLIRNEITFLENQSKLAESIGSLQDASDVSRQLESHYIILQSSIRQTIIGISLGNLAYISKRYDTALSDSQALVSTNRGVFDLGKQNTLDRWVLQITNTRSLYQQKIDAITKANTALSNADLNEIDRSFNLLQSQISEAKQYLQQGTSFMGELLHALKYVN